jgi:L,D-peptidoglycan transpeptidase YkuD (ErfK/YbiS/YcfS/YnhG family)
MDIWTVSPTKTGFRLATDSSTRSGHHECIIGSGGLIPAAKKREGDMATPLGTWAMRCLYFRPDRVTPPPTRLSTYPITPDLGWCDDPDDTAYNQLVRRPYPGRHEALWRSDARYDLLVVLGHNDAPPIRSLGSAIFLHLCDKDTLFTAGCVALLQFDMIAILAKADANTKVRITR